MGLNFDEAFKFILKQEGGYSDRPNDLGGPTKYGITLQKLRNWTGNPDLDKSAVEHLEEETAFVIYRRDYWDALNLDQITSYKKSLLIFDQAVNRGPVAAAMGVQVILNAFGAGIKTDGLMGPVTIAALNKAPEIEFCYRFIILSQKIYISIALNTASQVSFLKGWLSRTHALLMSLL